MIEASAADCANCAARPAWRTQRCQACYFYRRRHGVERPRILDSERRRAIAAQRAITEDTHASRIDPAFARLVLAANRVRIEPV